MVGCGRVLLVVVKDEYVRSLCNHYVDLLGKHERVRYSGLKLSLLSEHYFQAKCKLCFSNVPDPM